MYYYATRNDTKGQKLMTSYEKVKQRDQFVKGESTDFDGYKYLDVVKNTVRETTSLDEPGPDEVVVRSFIDTRKPPEGSQSGRFEIFAFDGKDNSWKPTGFRAEFYGGANTLLKALAPLYGKIIVVDHEPTEGGSQAAAPRNYADDSPF